MYLHALATAVPPASFSQADCWDIVQRSPVRSRLKKRSMLILHSILRGDHGIERRHFAVPAIEGVFDLTPDALNQHFRTEAPRLAGRGDAHSGTLEEGSARTSASVLSVCDTCLQPERSEAILRTINTRVSSPTSRSSPQLRSL